MDEKRKKELTERITKGVEEVRQTAVAIEATMQKRVDKFKEEIQQSEVSKEYKSRTDAELRLKRMTSKSKEKIIESGSAFEVACLYIVMPMDEELDEGERPFLTKEEDEQIQKRLTDGEILEAISTYNEHKRYKKLETDFKLSYTFFLKDVAVLSIYAKMWEIFERETSVMTQLFKADSPDRLKELVDGKTFKEKYKHIEHVGKLVSKTFEGVPLGYDKDKDTFFLNYANDSGFLDNVAYRSYCLKNSMRHLKGNIEAIERRLKRAGRKTSFLPPDMEILIRDTKNEASVKGFGVAQEYLRSYLNKRVAKGEKVTARDIQKAIFPDYYELLFTSEDNIYYDRIIATYFKVL